MSLTRAGALTLQSQLPAAVNMGVRYDRSQSIRASVNDVEFTLVLTIGLVVAVIFLFLRNLRATIIPSLAGRGFEVPAGLSEVDPLRAEG